MVAANESKSEEPGVEMDVRSGDHETRESQAEEHIIDNTMRFGDSL